MPDRGEMQMEDEITCAEQYGNGETDMERAVERLAAAAEMLERTVEKMSEREGTLATMAEARIEKIVATVESRRELELEQRLAAAEQELLELRAKAATVSGDGQRGRKTIPSAMAHVLAKQGVAIDSLEAGALDAALGSLSLEQRIAVKAQLMRSGLLG